MAQVKSADQIEPLPDIDFNIWAENTLVGFATYEEARSSIEGVTDESGAVQARMDYGGVAEKIRQRAEDVERLFEQFRSQQTEHGGEVKPEDKQELRRRLGELDLELDRYLASEYGINSDDFQAFACWKSSHQPFHWIVEFYGIMKHGGFDVIIGNPPWKEYAAVGKTYTVLGYKTERCGTLHNLCTARALQLRSNRGWFSFIVQRPLASWSRMAELPCSHDVVKQASPSRLFAPPRLPERPQCHSFPVLPFCQPKIGNNSV